MAKDELFGTCWTTAGDTSPDRDDLRSPVDFRDRVEAATRSGFTGGMGFLYVDLIEAEKRYGLPGMRAILADNGVSRLEVELLVDWWADGARRAASDEVRHGMLRLAEALGVYDIKIGPDDADAPWDFDVWAKEFAALAQQAHDVGARLAIEFLPWTNVKTITDGLRLVEAAGHPAGGLIVDVWHTERAGTPHADLAAAPLERLVGIELSDAAAAMSGTILHDTMHNRRLPGQGDFDLPGVVAALREAGWTGPWGVEILSSDYRVLPLDESLPQISAAARALLDA